MLIFKALHILSMFAAVTFLVGEALLYGRAIWRGDIAALAAVRRLLGGRPVAGVVFLLSGIVFGALAALTGQIDLLEGWLVAAYALVVVLFLVNASPWVQRLPRLGSEAIALAANPAMRMPVAADCNALARPNALATGNRLDRLNRTGRYGSIRRLDCQRVHVGVERRSGSLETEPK